MIAKLIEFFLGRSKSVNVNSLIYEELQEKALSEGVSVEFYTNNLLRESLDRKEKEILDEENWLRKQKELIPYYKFLDTYLNATLNSNVEIGITNELVGYESHTDVYELLSYDLTNKYRSLTLYLRKDNKDYPISFEEIQDIKFLDNGTTLKVWIYMPYRTWRFYLKFDESKLNQKFQSKAEIVEPVEVWKR